MVIKLILNKNIWLDSKIKGRCYYSTRDFYAENHKQYFNKIGEIYATILFEGKAIGIWSLDVKKNKIEIEFLEASKS